MFKILLMITHMVHILFYSLYTLLHNQMSLQMLRNVPKYYFQVDWTCIMHTTWKLLFVIAWVLDHADCEFRWNQLFDDCLMAVCVCSDLTLHVIIMLCVSWECCSYWCGLFDCKPIHAWIKMIKNKSFKQGIGITGKSQETRKDHLGDSVIVMWSQFVVYITTPAIS